MTRQSHDQFAKQYLSGLLEPLGKVEVSKEVSPEVRQIDVWFSPTATGDHQSLGLLGKIVENTCILEPFRNPPSATEIRNCMLKLFTLHTEDQRKAKREGGSIEEENLVQLWILAPTVSAGLLAKFGAKMNFNKWPKGVYFLPDGLKTAIVAINQLPKTPETLWLRILGKGGTQEKAIEELMALSSSEPLRIRVLEQIAIWRLNVESQKNLNEEDRELIMTLSPAYLQWREATLEQGRQAGLQEGRQVGLQEGRRLFIENFLRLRFGSVDQALFAIIEPILELPTEESLQLLWQLSREELLARFTPNRSE